MISEHTITTCLSLNNTVKPFKMRIKRPSIFLTLSEILCYPSNFTQVSFSAKSYIKRTYLTRFSLYVIFYFYLNLFSLKHILEDYVKHIVVGIMLFS